MIITREFLRKYNACSSYQGGKLNVLIGDKQEMSVREIVALPIPHADKMWLLTHAMFDRDPWLCYDFAIWCARESLAHVETEWKDRIAAVIDQCSGLRDRPAYAAYAAAYAAYAAAANAADAANAANAYAAAANAADAANAANAYAAAAAAAASAQIDKALEILEG